MAVFAITFRVGDEGDYDDRYSSITKKIEEIGGEVVWDETTSFYILNSTKNSQSICDEIYLKSTMIEDWDVLVVINLTAKGYAQKGAKYPAILASFLDHR